MRAYGAAGHSGFSSWLGRISKGDAGSVLGWGRICWGMGGAAWGRGSPVEGRRLAGLLQLVAVEGRLAPFAAGFAGLLRGELMSRAPLVGGLTAFAAGLPCFFGREFVGRALGVGGLPAFAGDMAAL